MFIAMIIACVKNYYQYKLIDFYKFLLGNPRPFFDPNELFQSHTCTYKDTVELHKTLWLLPLLLEKTQDLHTIYIQEKQFCFQEEIFS